LQTAIEVSEVMHRGVVTTAPEMPIAEAASLMVKNSIGGLPVMDAEGQVVGIITETDIFKAFVEMMGKA
jgi:acetoin utilization protein AcuB